LKHLRLALAVCAIGLAGCQTTAPTTGPAAPSTVEVLTLQGAQRLAQAHNAYQAAAAVATAAVKSHKLTRAQLLSIRSIDRKATAILSGAGTALSVAERASQLEGLTAQVLAIVGGK
jgi:hypothetical protein